MNTKKKISNDLIENLIKDYKDGYLTNKEIMIKFGIKSTATFARYLKNTPKRVGKAKNGKKYFCNENIFNNIDTQEKSYWLGFLYADGFNCPGRGIGITLQVNDINHLEKFKTFIEANSKIRKWERKNFWIGNYFYKEKLFCSITIYNEVLRSCLEKLGCTPRKSLTLQFPTLDQVPNHLIHHFIRGYFDGDGCLSKHLIKGYDRYNFSMELVGTKCFIESYVLTIKNNLNIKLPNFHKEKNLFRFKINGNNKTRIVLNWLYKDSIIYLDRKYNLYKEFLEQDVRICGGSFDWRSKKWIFRNEENQIIEINNLRKFCRENPEYDRSSMRNLYNGKIKKYKNLIRYE